MDSTSTLQRCDASPTATSCDTAAARCKCAGYAAYPFRSASVRRPPVDICGPTAAPSTHESDRVLRRDRSVHCSMGRARCAPDRRARPPATHQFVFVGVDERAAWRLGMLGRRTGAAHAAARRAPRRGAGQQRSGALSGRATRSSGSPAIVLRSSRRPARWGRTPACSTIRSPASAIPSRRGNGRYGRPTPGATSISGFRRVLMTGRSPTRHPW